MKVVIDETFTVTEAVPIGTTLYGGRAIQALIANMKSINAGQEPGDLKTLRSFRWMMDNKEMDLFEGWTRESVLNERERMIIVKAKAIKYLEDSPLAKGKH